MPITTLFSALYVVFFLPLYLAGFSTWTAVSIAALLSLVSVVLLRRYVSPILPPPSRSTHFGLGRPTFPGHHYDYPLPPVFPDKCPHCPDDPDDPRFPPRPNHNPSNDKDA